MSVRCPNCGEKLDIVKAPKRNFDHDQALALIRFGATASEVAQEFGVSTQRIYQLIQEDKKWDSVEQ